MVFKSLAKSEAIIIFLVQEVERNEVKKEDWAGLEGSFYIFRSVTVWVWHAFFFFATYRRDTRLANEVYSIVARRFPRNGPRACLLRAYTVLF